MAAQSATRQRTRPTSKHKHNMDTAPNYEHKKFSALKRKRSQDEELDDVVFVMEQPAKRRFFRPWLDEPTVAASQEHTQQPPRKPSPITVATTYHANMVRTHTPRLRSPKAQQRRDRNTLACLLSRRARQVKQVAMEEQCEQFRLQHNANLEQQIRLSLYYVRFLQQATRTPLPDTHSKLQQVQKCFPQQTAAMKR